MHIDSRSKSHQTDVFFYYQDKNSESKHIAPLFKTAELVKWYRVSHAGFAFAVFQEFVVADTVFGILDDDVHFGAPHQQVTGKNSESKHLSKTMKSTFEHKYNRHQPGRGFTGTVGQRGLYVLRKTTP